MKEKIIRVYLAAELILLFAIKRSESFSSGFLENIVKYLAIVCSTAVAAFFFAKKEKGRDRLIAYGLFATAAGDFFLTFLSEERFYLPGILMFCLVQAFYQAWLRPVRGMIAAEAVLFACELAVLAGAGELSPVNAAGALDIALLFMNTLAAWLPGKNRPPVLFRLGIALFLCCDLSLFVREAASGALSSAADWLTWICYVPSQVLITLTYAGGFDKKRNGEEVVEWRV